MSVKSTVFKVFPVGLVVLVVGACGNDSTSKDTYVEGDASDVSEPDVADDTTLDIGPDVIACEPCTNPPVVSCDGGDLVSWGSLGTCEDGTCVYTESRTTCERGCEAGACLGDPCNSVTCDSPPGACFAAIGTCTSGVCSYAPLSDTTCDDADPCTSNDTCQAGTCGGQPISCETPPAARCVDGGRLEVFANAGVCGAGTCTYAPTTVNCPSGCVDDACVGDPCEGVLCESPPNGCYETEGTCNNGVCSYVPDNGRTCNDENSCTTNDTCLAGVCRGTALACTTPDFGPTCVDANTRRTPVSPGTCGGGACTYGTRDTACAFGCDNGSCVGDPCNGVSCNTLPAPACQGSTLRTAVAASGACSGGTCGFSYTETVCANGCASGACIAPTGLVISELLYDSTSSPDKDAFLEIHGAPGTSLAGVKIVAVNGNGGAEYETIALSGQLGQDGLFIIAHPGAQSFIADVADMLTSSIDLQNSPDSVQLRFGPQILDALAYGNFGGDDIAAGEGSPAQRTAVNESLARDHLYTDTGDNLTDFKVGPPTPGAPTPIASPCDPACPSGKTCAGINLCVCEPGYHDEGGACIVDQTCQPGSCSAHGTCTIVEGRVSCACSAGYTGAQCGQCASGFHDDGSGNCTDNACLPNPCSSANQGVCQTSTTTTSGYVCGCDVGYHPDGVDGCTSDPCRPNPCSASNQACQATGTTYSCYTPACDDGNPCTTNTLVNGICQTANKANGAACSNTLCVSNQTCQQGACQGGSAVTCDDDNPCTTNSCNPTAGCQYTANDSLIPDDGFACTNSTCQSGQARHTPNDALCPNSVCSGTGRCNPSHASANANGCYFTNPATPPVGATGPCSYYGACNETTGQFPLITLATGAACDDGLACTNNSTCTASGACVGQVVESCFGTSCATTTPFSGTINVTRAAVSGTITLNGAAWPTASPESYTAIFYMLDRETGKRHRLYQMTYGFSSPGYALSASTPPNYEVGLPPGVYDLIYSRGTSDDLVYATPKLDPVPMGYKVLRTNVVIGPGTNTLNINVTRAAVSGTITLNGAAWPTTSPESYTAIFYMLDRITGKRHRLYQMTYGFSSPGYALSASTPPTFEAGLPPGVYDLIYSRGTSADLVYATPRLDPVPMGYKILRENVAISAGSNTVDIDVPRASVSGAITLNGAAWPSTSPESYTAIFYMLDRNTGKRHRLYQMTYGFSSPGYALSASTPPNFEAGLPPGVYDLIYSRGTSDDLVYATPKLDPVPMGYKVLQENVVISLGANTLDINVPRAAVSGTITLNGAAWPSASPESYTAIFYMLDRVTGKRHRLYQMTYGFSSPGYALSASTPPNFEAGLPPGVYDLIYSRGTSDDLVYATPKLDPVPMGYKRLRENVTINAGANTLNIDVTRAAVSGTITLNGAAWPSASPESYTAIFYMLDRVTGKRHRLYQMTYGFSSPGYALSASTPPTFEAGLPPGVYDLIYSRGTSDDLVYATPKLDPVPMGYRVLGENVTIVAGSNTLNIDVARAAVAGTITVNGATWPTASPESYTAIFYMLDRETGKRHRLYQMTYGFSSPGYALSASTPPTFEAGLPPGVYDLIYSRGTSDDLVYATPKLDPIPMGYRVLNRCVQVP